MSWQMKFLLVFTVIVMGTVLYFKRQPAMDFVMAANASRPMEADTDTSAASADAFQTQNALWNAIAPCWNRAVTPFTLPVRLKLSFDAKGQLGTPPEIDRDPNAPLTEQSLQSEALALQAVGDCGAYPMARGQQGVVIRFPTASEITKAQQIPEIASRK